MDNTSNETSSLVVPKRLDNSLQKLASRLYATPAQVLSALLDAFLEEPSRVGAPGRLGYRKKTCLPCVLRLADNDASCIYKPAVIIDLSLSGMGIVIEDSRKSREEQARESPSFEVILRLGGEPLPTTFTCRTCHVHRNGALRMGGALITHDVSVLRSYFKIFARLDASSSV